MHSQIKVVRTVSERQGVVAEGGRGGERALGRSASVSVGMGGKGVEGACPEGDTNSSAALRKLKQIKESKEALRGRLSVLMIHDQRQEFKALSHQHKIAFHQQKRQEAQLIRQEKARIALARQKEMEAAAIRAREERMAHRDAIGHAHKQLSRGRSEDYRKVRQRRSEIEQAIQQRRMQDQEEKRAQQQAVRSYERTQRTSVAKYRKDRLQGVREGEMQEATEVSRVRQQQMKEMQEMERLQQLMIRKQASSRQCSERSQLKLKELLNPSLSLSLQLPSATPKRTEQPPL